MNFKTLLSTTALCVALLGTSGSLYAGANIQPKDLGATDTEYLVSETDFNILRSLKREPKVNTWSHKHEYSDVKSQQVIRENQDALYSSAVVDISKGATFTVPEYPYYSIIQIIDMQNYSIGTVYPGQSIHITKDDVSYGHYVYLNARTRPGKDEKTLDGVFKQQDKLKIEAASAIPYTSPDIVLPADKLLEIRTALIGDVKKGKVKSHLDMMGKKGEVDRQDHLYASAFGWGGLPARDAVYIPLKNSVKTTECSSITIDVPPVDYDKSGFWSITAYNQEGWLAFDKAAIFNKDAVQNEDGTVTVRFNCEGKPNNLQTVENFAAVLRMYRPTSHDAIKKYVDNADAEYLIKAEK